MTTPASAPIVQQETGRGQGRRVTPRLTLDQIRTLPALLGARELVPVFGVDVSQIHRWDRSGLLDIYKVHPALGPKRFSTALIVRHLSGEPARLSDVRRRRIA